MRTHIKDRCLPIRLICRFGLGLFWPALVTLGLLIMAGAFWLIYYLIINRIWLYPTIGLSLLFVYWIGTKMEDHHDL